MADAKPDLNLLNGLIRGFLNHRVAPNLIAIVMVIVGLVALTRLNTQFFPTTEIPTITVSIVWPGASAEEMSEAILDIVEPEIRFVDGIDKVTSNAVDGQVGITLEFKEDADMQKALSDVESRLATITTLPQEAERPIVTRAQLYETVGYVAISGPFEEAVIQDAAKRCATVCSTPASTASRSSGKRDRRSGSRSPTRPCSSSDFSARDIAQRIAVVSQDTPLGNLEGASEKQLRALGRMMTADGVAEIELKAFSNGHKILIRDVAVVKESYQDGDAAPVSQRRDGGAPQRCNALFPATRSVDDAQCSRGRGLRARARRRRGGSVRRTRQDRRSALRMLSRMPLQGFALVVLVLIVFLSARVAFWVAIGVPISLLGDVRLHVQPAGQTINAVSLVALILVLGIIVDDAIVVAEATVTRTNAVRRARRSPGGCHTNGSPRDRVDLHDAGRVLADVADYRRHRSDPGRHPMVVVVALMASLIECFLTLPSHLMHSLWGSARRARRRLRGSALGRTMRRGFDRGSRPAQGTGRLADRARLPLAVCHRGVVRGRLDRIGCGSFWWAGLPSRSSRCQNRRRSTRRDVHTWPAGTARIAALRRSRQARWRGAGLLERRRGDPAAGEMAGAEYRLIMMSYLTLGQMNLNRGENLAQVEVELTPGEERSIRTREFIAAWQKALPSIVGIDGVAILGRRVGPPGFDIDVRLTGANLDQLKRAALDLRDVLNGYSGLSDWTMICRSARPRSFWN